MTRILGYNLKRVYKSAGLEDFTGSHYLYNRDRALERLGRYIQAVDTRKAPVFSIHGQVEFVVAPPGYVSQYARTVIIFEGGSPTD